MDTGTFPYHVLGCDRAVPGRLPMGVCEHLLALYLESRLTPPQSPTVILFPLPVGMVWPSSFLCPHMLVQSAWACQDLGLWDLTHELGASLGSVGPMSSKHPAAVPWALWCGQGHQALPQLRHVHLFRTHGDASNTSFWRVLTARAEVCCRAGSRARSVGLSRGQPAVAASLSCTVMQDIARAPWRGCPAPGLVPVGTDAHRWRGLSRVSGSREQSSPRLLKTRLAGCVACCCGSTGPSLGTCLSASCSWPPAPTGG